jgi:type VI secretion system protein ImpA
MTASDLAPLLLPVSDDAPSGPAIEYDDQFIELERIARGVAQEEDADGKVVREAREPDWAEVERLGRELAARSKDLRVGVYLARAMLAQHGLPGFRDGLELIRGYVSDFWPSVHPQLDPDDGDDPAGRLNQLAELKDNDRVLRELRQSPLTKSRQFGRISYRDFAVATGLLPPLKHDDGRLPDASRIEAAFADTPIETLMATHTAIAGSLESLSAIDRAVDEAVGAGKGVDLMPLEKQLGEMKKLVDLEVAKRGGGAHPLVNGEDAAAPAAETPRGVAGPGAAAGGPCRSRDDVLLLIDRICRYYADYEPSSPVPLILNRTKRLVTMNFLDILKELTPGGVQEFGTIAGIKEEEG